MKSMFKEYRDYLKDNPEGYWFKRKIYGWGWVPVTWQGWGVLTAFCVLLTLNSLRLYVYDPKVSPEVVITFVIETWVMVVVLLAICYKTGERPKWMWGLPKQTKHDE